MSSVAIESQEVIELAYHQPESEESVVSLLLQVSNEPENREHRKYHIHKVWSEKHGSITQSHKNEAAEHVELHSV